MCQDKPSLLQLIKPFFLLQKYLKQGTVTPHLRESGQKSAYTGVHAPLVIFKRKVQNIPFGGLFLPRARLVPTAKGNIGCAKLSGNHKGLPLHANVVFEVRERMV